MPFPSNEYNYWGHDAYHNEPFGWVSEKVLTPEEKVEDIVIDAHLELNMLEMRIFKMIDEKLEEWNNKN